MEEQQQAIEKCLVPVVQAYYSDYNKSLSSLTAICDDFRQNQKEVIELSRRVDEVKTKMSGSHSGVKDLLKEFTLKSLKNVEYIRQAPKMVDQLVSNSLYPCCLFAI